MYYFTGIDGDFALPAAAGPTAASVTRRPFAKFHPCASMRGWPVRFLAASVERMQRRESDSESQRATSSSCRVVGNGNPMPRSIQIMLGSR